MTITTADVPVGGHRFRVHETGDPSREAVLWLHGSGPGATALSNWERVIGDLSGDLHNIAPDIIGFGDSSHPDPPPPTAADFTQLRVDTLLGLLDELGVERAHLVGNSMGGIIGLGMALQHPDRIGRIVLMGSGGAPVPLTEDLLKLITYYDDPTAEALADLMRAMTHDPSVLGESLEKIAESRMDRIQRPEVRRSHLATFAHNLPGLYEPDQLAGLRHPVLVVHGREDRIIPLAAGHYFAEHIPDAQLYVMPNAGHWAQIEQPERFAHVVGAFLTGRI
ncbi:alpha/beta fold hydrolase [Actinomadura bangladeshensis]|uniref:Alpha/beta fold hydrolase n=1 Tax=Actinomadura bangladeshensis TaxID=453573 RepID=A0A6L9QBV2_9ACTN|nr:alpha/beta hydrolase [Actinomadura bangladeshensis]NEA21714.1 alpha/beta fold hydrolase [Actinomadura bangladeshensis]